MKSTGNEKKWIVKFYTNQLRQYGPNSHESLHWSDKNAQLTRFEALAEVMDLNGKRILDYGCGLGDLYPFLRKKIRQFEYIGIDIVPGFVEGASKKYPDMNFRVADLTDLEHQNIDVVLASGVFSYLVDDHEQYYLPRIKWMYNLAKQAVAFNMLDMSMHPSHNLFATYDKEEVADYCSEFADAVKLNDTYIPQDFTLYLYKKA